jgi:hypothetical protein
MFSGRSVLLDVTLLLNIFQMTFSLNSKVKKVKLSRASLIKHYAMKMYEGWMYRPTFS